MYKIVFHMNNGKEILEYRQCEDIYSFLRNLMTKGIYNNGKGRILNVKQICYIDYSSED